MELDYSQGYCPAPNTIFRKEANLSMRESATLTYLLSHREGVKVSYRRISKDLHSDFRTVKKVIEKLKTKGYEVLINKVLLNYNTLASKCSNNNTFNKNSNTSSSSKKLQHFINNRLKSKEIPSLKKFTQNKVLEHISGGVVTYQHKVNNKELIKANFKIIIGKKDKRNYPCFPKEDLPVFEYVEETSIKEQPITINKDIKLEPRATTLVKAPALTPTLKKETTTPKIATTQQTTTPSFSKETTTLNTVTTFNTHLKSIFKKVNPKYRETEAIELPLSLTEDYFKVGKTINSTLDLYHKYQLFRANKIKKNHSNSNWINAWKSWLENGITKYKKGTTKMHYVKENQPLESQTTVLLESEEEKNLKECTALIEEAKNWLYTVEYKLSKEFNKLFMEKLSLERTPSDKRSPELQKQIDIIKKSLSNISWEKSKKTQYYRETLGKYQTIIATHKLSGWYDLEKEYLAYCDNISKSEVKS